MLLFASIIDNHKFFSALLFVRIATILDPSNSCCIQCTHWNLMIHYLFVKWWRNGRAYHSAVVCLCECILTFVCSVCMTQRLQNMMAIWVMSFSKVIICYSQVLDNENSVHIQCKICLQYRLFKCINIFALKFVCILLMSGKKSLFSNHS